MSHENLAFEYVVTYPWGHDSSYEDKNMLVNERVKWITYQHRHFTFKNAYLLTRRSFQNMKSKMTTKKTEKFQVKTCN